MQAEDRLVVARLNSVGVFVVFVVVVTASDGTTTTTSIQEDVGEGLKGRVLYVKEEVDWPRKAFSDIAVIVCKGKRECV